MEEQLPDSSEIITNPWQMRHEVGWGAALWNTIKIILFNPTQFFKSLDPKSSIKDSFYFYSVITIATTVFAYFVAEVTRPFLYAISKTPQYDLGGLKVFVIIPLIALGILFIFIVAAAMHLAVILFKGKGGYKGTFHVLAYGSVATIFSAIPFMGSLLSAVWYIVIVIKGYRQVHQISTTQAAMAYFLIPALIFILALTAAMANPNMFKTKSTDVSSTTKNTEEKVSRDDP